MNDKIENFTTYVTFGQDHIHEIDDVIFDKNCVAAIPANNRTEGRDKAFQLFGRQFCFEYFGKEFKKHSLKYFPRGIIYIPGTEHKKAVNGFSE